MLARASKMLATLVAVLLTVEVAIRAVSSGFAEPVTWYHEIAQAKVEQIAEQDGELDYVFIGTSQTYHGIDPAVIDRRLSTRSYNAAIPAGIPPLQRRWLDDAVLPDLEVDTVVWPLSSIDLNAARPQEVAPLYDEAFEARDGVLAEVDRWLSARSATFRHRRTLADPRSWLEADDPVSGARDVLHANGKRRPGRANTSDAERRRIRRDVIGDYELGGRMSEDIRRTVGALREQGVDVVFVWLPQAPRFLDLLPDPSVDVAAEREARRLATDLDVPFVDVSDGYGNEDFSDFTHLSGDAAERLSAALADELAERRRR
ncbi:hypothetical protein NHL50_15785 [Acidimicrobiia bacterium EGI L10123]|uniref:hypothetical protein n=1 Tax=Salinilacustrithrix flava TaxID=2957203 RepID=UPI003D7C215C|nr:hypothetical protein [Acidimicrobiia bacterium EGI L10123]